MSDLQIPDAADDLWFECGCQDERCDREGYQKEALPFIVAAELRRLADEIYDGTDRSRVWAQVIHARADELDGGAK